MAPHPLAQLSPDEFRRARDIVRDLYEANTSILFRAISLSEPAKADLIPFLEAEHAGADLGADDARRPPRLALVEHDLVGTDAHEYVRAVVNIGTGDVVSKESAGPRSFAYYTPGEFGQFQDICVASDKFKEAMSEFVLPEGFTVAIDPWPYGGPDEVEDAPRYMQGLVFAQDSRKNNPDTNHYAYPIPIIPIMDWVTKEIVRVDRLATGGAGEGLEPAARSAEPKKLFGAANAGKHAEYVPELLDRPLREDLKPLNVVQPEGASFNIHPDGLIEWQKWRFRLGVTPREGGVLHDVCYEGRPILYRLSYSELTVPYGDPRPPFHRKQAFDLGDGGLGRMANNLELGCDCLGAIHYVDGLLSAPDGEPTPAKSVICLHEQDNGILWKHSNFRTDRAVVTRNRELVVQFICTLANYEYIFAFKLDLAGGITVETRATGIMSVVAIDEGKTSPYGAIVAPGILAQNHQHIFAVRVDPAVDSYTSGDTRIVVEESVPQKRDPVKNPFGNYYAVERQIVDRAKWIDAEPRLNRTLRFENSTKKNEVSGKNVGYKLISPVTQLLLADEECTVARRAQYSQHHYWVTGYRDGELWAAGEFTNQSKTEAGGVSDMVKRGDWFTGEGATGGEGKESSPVVWSVFGFTHNPRVEDWPVM